MHIRKKLTRSGETRWQVRVSTRRDGKRFEMARDFARKAEAEGWARDQGALVERRQVSGGRATFAAYLERWLSYLGERGTLEKKTIQEYRNHGRRLLPLIGGKSLRDLTAEDLDHAYTALL